MNSGSMDACFDSSEVIETLDVLHGWRRASREGRRAFCISLLHIRLSAIERNVNLLTSVEATEPEIIDAKSILEIYVITVSDNNPLLQRLTLRITAISPEHTVATGNIVTNPKPTKPFHLSRKEVGLQCFSMKWFLFQLSGFVLRQFAHSINSGVHPQ